MSSSMYASTNYASSDQTDRVSFLWHCIALAAVVFIPTQLRAGRPLWEMPVEGVPQALASGAAYLVLALFVESERRRRGRVPYVLSPIVGILCFAAAHYAVLRHPHLVSSRVRAVVAVALGVVLVATPYLLGRRWRTVATVALALGTVGFAATFRAERGDPAIRGAFEAQVVRTASESLSVVAFPGLAGRVEGDGGAIARYRDGFVLVTGRGAFFHLRWDSTGRALRSEAIDLPSPMDRAGFLADQAPGAPPLRLRVTDLALDTSVTPTRLYVSHQYWNRQGKCFTHRVSATPLDGPAPHQWTSVYESRPCIVPTPAYDDAESGGRLAWDARGRLLLTLGDAGFAGFNAPPLSQQPDADNGKIVRLDLAGGREIVSIGHRNPQGLAVDRDGRIWETEHGPRGGDELNLIVEGKNYGWPLATYGTDYTQEFWPMAPGLRDHGRYEEPAHAFVPSVAVSNLIPLDGDEFPTWRGDLLLSSLRTMSLFRARVRDGRVIYVEPITIGRKIRDLEQAADGRVVLWTEPNGELLVLSQAAGARTGEQLFARCSGCHEPLAGRADLAPPLRGIVGRGEGAARWTPERLDAFLADPDAHVAASGLRFGRLPRAADRRALIDYLTRLR